MAYIISEHAASEMERRQVFREQVLETLERPQQRVATGGGREVFQSRYFDWIENKELLLRVVTESKNGDVFVITVYKTSRIGKYWMEAL